MRIDATVFVLLEMAVWAARKGEDGNVAYIAVGACDELLRENGACTGDERIPKGVCK